MSNKFVYIEMTVNEKINHVFQQKRRYIFLRKKKISV